MWQQIYDPLSSSALSAVIAALPIIIFLLGLTVFKLTGIKAASISLASALIIAVVVFHMPWTASLSALTYGALGGLWPIGWIVLMAVWLYRIAVRAGNFKIIQDSISAVSADQRIQVLLIAFCFGGFLEGAAGFGIPIAICAALLVTLGFDAIKASVYALISNAAYGAYGAIGIPVIVGAKQGSVELSALSIEMILTIQLTTALIPLILVFVQDGIRAVKETGLIALIIGFVVSGLQALMLWTLGPELADIIPPLIGLVILALVMRRWQPAHIYRESGAPEITSENAPTFTAVEVAKAWSPFCILSGMILLWSTPFMKALWAVGGPLDFTTIKFSMPYLHQGILQVAPIVAEPKPMSAIFSWGILSASGTAIFIAALLTIVTSNITIGAALQELQGTVKQLWKPIVMICLVMAVANVMNFGGLSSSIALAVAAAGSIFPLLSPIIGWIGVFVTGSVVNNNTLFAALQATTAQQIGTSPTLLVASNTTGGVMAKIVSPQSIAIAAASVGLSGEESKITSAAFKYSVVLLAWTCLWVFALSLVL
ncbi:L-lactate permease [Rothia sp. P7181]|uniref:L-lactate permease n=1 Tax=unclassified Rothia (in: high G+C Gram-positive bacteria) TaxID=2689056 RepID=UPI003AC258FD